MNTGILSVFQRRLRFSPAAGMRYSDAMSKAHDDPAAAAALERFKAQRVTALYRLDLIEKGATLTYDDGTPVDMASEKARLQAMTADMDRRIAGLERDLDQA